MRSAERRLRMIAKGIAYAGLPPDPRDHKALREEWIALNKKLEKTND